MALGWYLAVSVLIFCIGAGGVMVPLNERDLMVDLMRHVGFPVVVAARTALGTINHTLLTLAALRHADLKICGVVMIGKENLENTALPLAITAYVEERSDTEWWPLGQVEFCSDLHSN